MPVQWTTFPMEFKGGLISNLTPLQQGVNAVGSATILQNFESNKEGGYSKIKGYTKFSDTEIPGTGEVLAVKVVSANRAVVARKMDTASVTAFQTATSTVNNITVNYTVTVVDDGGQDKFAIDGSTAPTLALLKGYTYIFDVSDSTVSGHPLGFKDSDGNAFTTGVTTSGTAGTAGATVTIAVGTTGGQPARYYCITHGDVMGNTITTSGTANISLDNNTATAMVNGATTSSTTVTLDRVRPFTAVTGTASASGTSATFDITNTNGTYSAAVNAGGQDYATSETITILGTDLGGETTANDATVTVSSVGSTVSYSNPTNTYNGTDGTGFTFDIARSGGSYSITIDNAGTGGYAVNETLTVAGTELGGATTANDATVTINTINNVAVSYTNPAQSGYSGTTGSGATFDITRSNGSYSVAITSAGTNFVASETITIVGTELGGATTANDATITINTVDGSGGITAATITGTAVTTGTVATASVTGTAVTTGPITGVTVAGTGAAFGTITRGMVVTGTGINNTVTVETVTSQNSIILDTAVSLADDTVLSFITNIKVGMYVTGTGITGDVQVSTVTDQSNIVLDSAQILTDNTVLTFGTFSSSQVDKTVYYYGTGTTWTTLGTSTASDTFKSRHFSFNFTGDEKTIFVDGKGYPAIYDSSDNTMTFLSASDSTDVEGVDKAVIFKNTGFYAKDNIIYFTAPATIDDFSVANGAGSLNVAHDVTGMIVFRDQLIVFTTDTIKRLVGNTAADFVLEPITDKIGCINPDTIQEFGGDVVYLSPDGVRLLGATDRIGDFALDVASDNIYTDAKEFISQTDKFCSVLVRNKSQYRIFSYIPSTTAGNSKGLIATKFISQGGTGISWSTTKGIKANVADSTYSGSAEVIMFANEDGYCYELDSGNSFDGANIEAVYESPYMPITDPQIRKTMYKLTLYAEPTGQMDLDVDFTLDFDSKNDLAVVQPSTLSIGTAAAPTVTALVNGATTSDTLVTVDNNVGTIAIGQTVVGTGISGTVKVTGVTDQQNIILDTAVSLADNTSLTFITPSASGVFLYGAAASLYGTATYGGTLDKIYKENLIGSFKTVAMRITDDSTNPTFTLDTAVLEYRQHDRQ